MPDPTQAFVIVIETNAGHDPDRMPLLSRALGGRRLAPAFSSMQHATSFLARAQELGHVIKLDYIFPADRQRLARDFPGHEFRLDPSPEAFFQPDFDRKPPLPD